MAYLAGSVKGSGDHPDFTVAINQAAAAQRIKDWFMTNGKRVGQSMFNHNTTVHFDEWISSRHLQFKPNDLKNLLLDSNGTFIKGADVQQALEGNSLVIQTLLVIAEYKLGHGVIDQIKEVWRKHDPAHVDLAFQIVDGQFDFFENFYKTNAFLDLARGAHYGTVQSKCLAYQHHQDSETCYPVGGPLPMPACIPGDVHQTWGAGVESWLNSQKGSLGGIFIRPPNNHNTYSPSSGGGGGCFIAGTVVVVVSKDGKSIEHVPIEQVQAGDLVVSHNGSLSVVSDEPVVRQLQEDVTIYGIKAQQKEMDLCPFFTKGHPFWTAEGGWCAVCPRCANAENEWMRAKMLGVGSTVFKVRHARVKRNKPYKVKVIYDRVRITELTERVVSKPVVYGLHFREGERSYHANGFLVGLNYPELTATRLTHILASASHMHYTDQQQLHSALSDVASGLSHATGSDWPYHGIGRAVDAVRHTAPHKHHRNGHFYRNHASLFRTYHLSNLTYKLHKLDDSTPPVSTHTHLRADKHREEVPESGKLHLVGGKVAMDEQVAHNAHFTDDGHVVADFSPSMLLVRMHPTGLGGFAVKARLSDDQSRVEAIEESYAISAENTYNTKYQDGGSWTSWFQVHMGLDTGAPIAFLSDPKEAPTSSLNKHLSKIGGVAVENGQLQVQLDFGQYSFVFGWHSGEALVSDDFRTFNGTLYKYDSNKKNGKGAAYTWTGTISTAHQEEALASLISHPASLLESACKDKEADVPIVPLSAANPVWASRTTNLLEEGLPMRVEELAEMAPPDSQQVNKLSFDKLVNLMKATVDSSTLATLLDDTPPVLSGPEQAIIDDNTNGQKARKFLSEKFFRAYAVQALSGSPHLTDDFGGVPGGVDTTKERLHYFWQGAGKADDVLTADKDKADSVLSQDSGYDFVNNGVARLAYSESLPALQRYLQNSPASWGEQLHAYVTRTEYVNGLAIITAVTDNSKLNKLAMILYSLAPSEKYATDLCARVLEAQSNYLRQHFASLDEQLMKTFIPAIIAKLVNLVDADDPTIKLSAQIKAEVVSQVRAAMVEAGTETAQAFLTKFSSLSEECGVFMAANRNQPVWQRLSSWWGRITEDFPISSKIGKGLVTLFGHAVWITTIGVTIYSLIILGKNWSTFRTDQKVAIIMQGSAVLSDVIAKVPKAWNGLKEAFNFDDMFDFEGVFEEEDLQQLWGHYLDDTAVEYNPDLDLAELDRPAVGAAGAVAADDVQATRLWADFSIAEKAARLTNVLAMGAAVVSMGFQVNEDFKNDAPTAVKVLDIINIVAAGIGFGAEALALAGELGLITLSEFVAGAVIPVVGAVVAIVGVIITLVLLFEHKSSKPRETPIDKWVKGTGVSFVNQLPTPTTAWNNQHVPDTKKSK